MTITDASPGQSVPNGSNGSGFRGQVEFDRTPPHDLAAEQSVLGGMLLSKDAVADVVEVVRSSDFYRPAHATVFEVVGDLYGRGEPADVISVAADLGRRDLLERVGGAGYLHTLISSVPTAANAGYYARIVAEKAVLRRLAEAGTRIVQLAFGPAMDVDDVVDRAQAAVYEVTERRTSEDYAPLGDLLHPAIEEIEAIAGHDGTLTGVPTGFNDLDELTNGLHGGQLWIVAARPAVGKALALDTPLPTPTGWTTMGEVAVGDLLMGADGKPTGVVATTGVMTGRRCYEVEFSDGTVVVADAEHQWLTMTRAARRYAKEGPSYSRTPVLPRVVTTEEMASTLRCPTADARLNHSVPVGASFDLPDVPLPVDPYLLGVWLGDGTSAAAQITTADPEIVTEIEARGYVVKPSQSSLYRHHVQLPVEYASDRVCAVCGNWFSNRMPNVRTCGKVCGGRLRFIAAPLPPRTCSDCGGPITSYGPRCSECHSAHGTVQGRLRTLGVLGNKHIPLSYLRAGEQQRRDLLAGLLDTDGTVHKNGCTAQFAVTSRRLAFDVRDLIVSLGYRPTVTTKQVAGRTPDSSVCYTVSFTPTDNVFRLSRKSAQFTAADHPKTRHRYVTAVRPVESVPVRCVEVDNADHLYLAGPTCIPTHNSTLGLDLARSASIKNGMTSVIFSLEMSRMEITMRLLSAEARVSLQNIRTGRLSDDDWQRLARRMGEVAEAPLFIDDSPHLTMMEIRAKARRLKQRNDLRLIVLDYLQLMSSPKRVENRQQEVSEISRSMKLLAKELDIPVIAISQLNRASEQRADKKPQLSDLRESGCLTGDTRLVRADTGAEVSLAELVLTGERNVPVWSVDEDLRLVRARLTHAFPSGTKDVYELRLRSGRVVRASANHQFLTLDGWRRLDELSAGTRIAAPRLLPEPATTAERPEAEVVMLAHLIGDCCVAPRQPIHYTSADEANVVAVETAAAHFGITPRRVRQKNWWHVYLPAPQKLARGQRNPIAAWLGDMGLYGLRSYEKFVPEIVFGLPGAQVALFLRHLWATDGSVRWDVKYGKARLCYASTSRRLVDDMARLLLRFGVYARVHTVRKPPYRDGYHLLIDGVDNQRAFLSEIGVHGARGENAQLALRMLADIIPNTSLDTVPKEIWDRVREVLVERSMSHRAFASAMGTQFCGSTRWKHAPSRSRLAKVAGVLDDAGLHLVATSDVYWDEVVSITDLGPQPVFDATVVGTHNFLADGIVAHNSLEQDADAVILLYREDAVERESARAGEADLIIAKHRNGPTGTVTVAFQGHYSRFVDMAT